MKKMEIQIQRLLKRMIRRNIKKFMEKKEMMDAVEDLPDEERV